MNTATHPYAPAGAGSEPPASAMFTGLLYPIGVCLVTLRVGGLFIRETKDHHIDAEGYVR